MSDQSRAVHPEDSEDEIFLEPCTSDTVYRTPYRDLLALNGNFSYSSQPSERLHDEDVWSTEVNVGEPTRDKKHTAHKHRSRKTKSGKKDPQNTQEVERAK